MSAASSATAEEAPIPVGGAPCASPVQGSSPMPTRCESTLPAPAAEAGLEGDALEHLMRVGGPSAPLPMAELRVRERDLVICDGAGVALYSLRITPTALGWEQRTVSFPPEPELWALREHPQWAKRARRICATSSEARSCRVGVGVVAAEARAAETLAELYDGEESIYRLSQAGAAVQMASDKVARKSGRLMLADIERARYPSHVPLYRLQGALAEELAFGHSVGALCSRSEGFSASTDESSVTNLLCRRLGLLGTRDMHKRVRFARVAPHEVAELLCEALDLAPEAVGL